MWTERTHAFAVRKKETSSTQMHSRTLRQGSQKQELQLDYFTTSVTQISEYTQQFADYLWIRPCLHLHLHRQNHFQIAHQLLQNIKWIISPSVLVSTTVYEYGSTWIFENKPIKICSHLRKIKAKWLVSLFASERPENHTYQGKGNKN